MIGHVAEFDFSGSHAYCSLREEGITVVLINSNPATIMTGIGMADAIEPPDCSPRTGTNEMQSESKV